MKGILGSLKNLDSGWKVKAFYLSLGLLSYNLTQKKDLRLILFSQSYILQKNSDRSDWSIVDEFIIILYDNLQFFESI